ncbi:MAG: hypothetical protein A4S09_00430 [Proteobacteria bacterium SG_bin7]|nr:MAG: hypothetical protein A4S09_00430 [Proteobacteria bacterium SG_bin7]
MRLINILAIAIFLLLQFQNCSGGGTVNFFNNRQSLSSSEQQGGGTTYDGKPEPGDYCRVFNDVPCQTQVSNIQSMLRVDNTKIQLINDNCTSTATNFQFADVAVGLSDLNRKFIGLSRGIFKKCEVNSSGSPLPPVEMPEAWCKAKQNNVDLVISRNLATQELKLELLLGRGTEVRTVLSKGVQKSQTANNYYYTLPKEKFDLSIPASAAQTSTGHLGTVVDNAEINVELDCRQANGTSTILIDRDLELHSSWIDTSRIAGYWKLNEVSALDGTSIADSSTFGHAGLLQTGDGLNKADQNVKGGALRFDGINDGVLIADPSDNHLDFDNRSFTFMVWVYKTAASGSWDMPIWKGGNAANVSGYDIECGSSACSAFVSDNTQIFRSNFGTTASQFFGRWVHFVATVDRSLNQFSTYVDGVKVSSTDISSLGNIGTSHNLNIGRSSLTAPFDSPYLGSIDDVAIWDKALSGTEVREIFQRLRPKFY